MRMNTIAGGHEAIEIVLPDVAGALRHAVSENRRVIVERKFGYLRNPAEDSDLQSI